MKKMILLFLFLFASLGAQVTDKNFKDKTGDGVTVVVFTSKWAESDGMKYVKGVNGHEDAIVIQVMSEDTKKICKKLRLRNYPSIALFINGDKIDTWKGDMDGVIEIEPSDIKDAIENALAGDQY
jgi:hypothetical protein|tara:strand:+ start:10815 stop:11189 length:375 start_codon:yes stop_codon:yes gene_type:complete